MFRPKEEQIVSVIVNSSPWADSIDVGAEYGATVFGLPRLGGCSRCLTAGMSEMHGHIQRFQSPV